jgi:hypothetical protein
MAYPGQIRSHPHADIGGGPFIAAASQLGIGAKTTERDQIAVPIRDGRKPVG